MFESLTKCFKNSKCREACRCVWRFGSCMRCRCSCLMSAKTGKKMDKRDSKSLWDLYFQRKSNTHENTQEDDNNTHSSSSEDS